MHRFYQPILPSSNLFLQHKWDFINYENHRQKLKNIRSRIDQTAPRTYTHMYIKLKQLQLEMERFCTIQRENKNLLDKLGKIQRYGGWIDNDNTQHKPRSINTTARQKEAVRICNENLTLLCRIQDQHTSYNRTKLESSYIMQQKYRANIDKFPREWKDMSKDMKRYRAEIREKYVHPKYGMAKSQKQKSKKVESKNEPKTEIIASVVNVEEPEVTIHVSEAADLNKISKQPMTVLERPRKAFEKQNDKKKVESPEEDEKELDIGKTEDETNQLKENDGVNQDKESNEVKQDKETDKVNQDKEKNEVDQDNNTIEENLIKEKDESNQVKEKDEANHVKEKDEVTQDKQKDEVNQDEETAEAIEGQEKDEINKKER